MNNAICINGPAEGQEIYLHDGWEPAAVSCEIKCVAMYRFVHMDNGKSMCKFVGLRIIDERCDVPYKIELQLVIQEMTSNKLSSRMVPVSGISKEEYDELMDFRKSAQASDTLPSRREEENQEMDTVAEIKKS